jgi:hypothetical protein
MSDAPKNIKSFINFRKKSLEAELLEKEPELMREYIDACSALLGIERSGAKHDISSTEFTPYRNAIDAIEAYLGKVNEFTDQDDVIDALIDGGYSPLDERRRPNIKDSIRYHTEKSKRLIIQGGKLGKSEWTPGPPIKSDCG